MSLRSVQLLLVVLALAVLLGSAARRISGAPVANDAAQSVLMAVNLAHHGVISLDEMPPWQPTDYREPLPVILAAAQIRLLDASLGPAAPAAYLSGIRVRLIKLQNLLWLALLASGAFLAIREISGSFPLAWLSIAAATYPFWSGHSGGNLVDDFYNDLPGTALLMLSGALLVSAVRHGRVRDYALVGVLFGASTLIKAASEYIFVGTALVVAVALLRTPGAVPRIIARNIAVMVLTFAVTLAPWIVRNVALLGTAEVSQRSGVVLMYRARYDQMTADEYRGSFYAWAPARLQPMIGRLLGYSPADLQRGGRLQRINENRSDFAAEDLATEEAGLPQKSLTYYRMARAERVQAEQQMSRSGSTQPEIAADHALKAQAMHLILHSPGRLLAVTVPFLWRGAFLAFPVLLIAVLWAWLRRDTALLVFAIAPFGTVLLYALFTQFIPRYGLTALSFSWVILLLAAYALLRAAVRRFPTRAARGSGPSVHSVS